MMEVAGVEAATVVVETAQAELEAVAVEDQEKEAGEVKALVKVVAVATVAALVVEETEAVLVVAKAEGSVEVVTVPR